MKLGHGDAPLARNLALATCALIPPSLWFLLKNPGTVHRLTGPCLLEAWTTIPCPTCGGTQAAWLIGHGRFTAALATNPLVTLALLVLAGWALGGLAATLVPRWRRRIEPAPGDGRRLVLVLGGLVLANWVYLVLT